MSRFSAIVFDFDGVVVDSEVVANTVLAEALTELGYPTTREQAIARYIGLHWADTAAAVELEMGRSLPRDFKGRTSEAFQRRLDEIPLVPGVQAFLDQVQAVPKAVASSSTTQWLRSSLERLGIAAHFGDRLYSAPERVDRGKPFPDIYLYAARALGFAPEQVVAIEDTAPGVHAAKAAGITVVGLCAGGHCGPGYEARLVAAGADRIAADYAQVLEFIS